MVVTVPEVRTVSAARGHSGARCRGNHYSPSFTKEETRAQRGCVTCGRPHSGKWQASAAVRYRDHHKSGDGEEEEGLSVKQGLVLM